ncbi:methyltransferase domain-containing protein [Colletotrichum fioriniae PJ7]|uniref:Methyltransferase domain-containing protein n=1 Tax=Colletotrichum fioriniae PJ7 TaxID=1445577 RepID=A0A010QYF8_9PEZI|nr:methyltransferase domain-containing protein [Colletotrichum fioriniae PJ7]
MTGETTYGHGPTGDPATEMQADIEGILHRAVGFVVGKQPPKRYGYSILDVGTGSGIWATDLAEYPSSRAFKQVLSGSQFSQDCEFIVCHQKAWDAGSDVKRWRSIPTTTRFCSTDRLEALNNLEDKFDYVHSRRLWEAIESPAEFFKQIFARLNPGGSLQLESISWLPVDQQCILSTSPKLAAWCGMLQRAMDAGDGGPGYAGTKGGLEKAGFVDVSQETVDFRLQDDLDTAGNWFKHGLFTLLKAGDLAPLPWLKHCRQEISARRPAFPLLPESIDEFLAAVGKELAEANVCFQMLQTRRASLAGVIMNPQTAGSTSNRSRGVYLEFSGSQPQLVSRPTMACKRFSSRQNMAIGQTPNVEHKLKSSNDSYDAEIVYMGELASQITIRDDRTTKTIDALQRRTRYADFSGVEEGTLIVLDRYYTFRTATLAMKQLNSRTHHTEDNSKNNVVLQDYSHSIEVHTSAPRPYILFGTAGTPITIDLLEELLRASRLLRPGAFIDVQFAFPDGYKKDIETSGILAMIQMMQSVGLENVNVVHFSSSIEPELVQEIGQGNMDDWNGMPGEGSAPIHESLEHFCMSSEVASRENTAAGQEGSRNEFRIEGQDGLGSYGNGIEATNRPLDFSTPAGR